MSTATLRRPATTGLGLQLVFNAAGAACAAIVAMLASVMHRQDESPAEVAARLREHAGRYMPTQSSYAADLLAAADAHTGR